MDLVVGEALTGRQVEQDRTRGVARGEDLRQARFQLERLEIPGVHATSVPADGTVILSFDLNRTGW